MTGVATHFVCLKGNDHWLSHVVDWDGDQRYHDRCHVHITVEGGQLVHLTILADVTEKEAQELGWSLG